MDPIVFAVAWMIGFLKLGRGRRAHPLVSLLGGAIALAIPLVFGALGGVLGERAGVVNIAIDGQLLLGAFAAAITASLTGSALGRPDGRRGGRCAVALHPGPLRDHLLRRPGDRRRGAQRAGGRSDQLHVPPGAGRPTPRRSTPPTASRGCRSPSWATSRSSGRSSSARPSLVYVLYIIVALVAWALYRTRWGLRVRAVGEHPKAADTVGIKVNRTRYRTILLAGAIAGLGGAELQALSRSPASTGR